MKKYFAAVFAVCMMFFAAGSCFALSSKSWYIVDSFEDLKGKWVASEDGQDYYFTFDEYSVTVEFDGQSESLKDYDEFSADTSVILLREDGKQFRVYVDDEYFTFKRVK